MDRIAFEDALQSYESRFNAMEPELELTIRDPEMGVEGWVVVWSTLSCKDGPLGRVGKGGTRIHEHMSMDELRMLARTQTLKNAAAGIGTGGAKSGMKDDPSSEGFEQRYRRFAKLVAPVLHENGGPWGGFGYDIGAHPDHCTWCCDELDSTRCFTGKPVEMGGTDYDVEGIAGLGVAVAARTMLEETGRSPSSATIAVQGVGAMGAAVCRYATEHGMTVRYIADPRIGGCWRIETEFDGSLAEAIISMDFEGARTELENGPHICTDLDDVLVQSVDVLFPCAVQYVITSDNVDTIAASAVVEGANNPCTMDARMELASRGVTVIPDFIANPGGAIAAYVELVSEISNEENIQTRAKVAEAKAFTEKTVADNVKQAMALADEAGVDLTRAGLYLSYQRVFGEA
ncbi:MAG: Glu/Leu/Phe/Val dehydrogenase dimerization domain-containing protein [Phycisphaerales bacterium]|nr:Glu/Leu/Phe/Val dehydrogenase dimerization domain-containing protein [Phycisphaerales bacterium]